MAPVQSWDEQQLAILRPQYAGRWELWTVRVLCPNHTVWCARPSGTR